MQLEGVCTVRQPRRPEYQTRPGDVELLDGVRPGEISFDTEYRRVVILVPYAALRPRLIDADTSIGSVLRATKGTGALVSAYVKAFARNEVTEPAAGSLSDITGRYNIGSVLVNPSGKLVCWARNPVGVTGNNTQHGEVRLMTNYLHNTLQGTLKGGYTVYTTLEPCAMCSGMMTLNYVRETVYGQADPGFGKALERLQFNSTSIHGYCPYPRGVTSGQEHGPIAKRLDEAYAQSMQVHTDQGITQFLAVPKARQIFADAEQQFQTYQVRFPSNQPVLDSARLPAGRPGTVRRDALHEELPGPLSGPPLVRSGPPTQE